MIPARRDSRVVLTTSIGGLVLVLFAGGFVMSALDGLSVLDGVWMTFSVISTVGFGEGPMSFGGRLLSVLAFAAASICYFWLIVVAVEAAMERFQHHALINEALRPLARRRADRLHQDN
jgi:ion channel